jgi:hypothetical protein
MVALASCQGVAKNRGNWPPDDFALDLEYTVVERGVRQVRKSARIFADGLVVYREADTTLRSKDGEMELPIYTRMCAYRMTFWSIRDLSRLLHGAPVQELKDPVAVPPIDKRTHLLRFHLVYMANDIDVVAQNQVVGLMNRAVRIVNTFLPPDGSITMPNMAGDDDPHHLQDVPKVTDSLAGALSFHETWLSARATDPGLLRDTFGLACTAKNWELAQTCVTAMSTARPADAVMMIQILADSRAAAN